MSRHTASVMKRWSGGPDSHVCQSFARITEGGLNWNRSRPASAHLPQQQQRDQQAAAETAMS